MAIEPTTSTVSAPRRWASSALSFGKSALGQAQGAAQKTCEAGKTLLEAGSHFRQGGKFVLLGRRLARDPENRLNAALSQCDAWIDFFKGEQPAADKANPPPILRGYESSSSPVAVAPKDIAPRAVAPSPHIEGIAPPAQEPRSAEEISKTSTEHHLATAVDYYSYFLPLFAMTMIGKIDLSAEPSAVFDMVKAAKRDHKTPREIFDEKYGNRLSWTQKIHLWFFNLIAPLSIFKTTLQTLLTNGLQEARQLAKTGWTVKEQNVENLIRDFNHFLVLYKNGTLDYANAAQPHSKGVSEHRKEFLSKMCNIELEALARRFSATVMTHFFPPVSYFSGEWFLPRLGNAILNAILRAVGNRFLPDAIMAGLDKTNRLTKPNNLPFAKSFTDTLMVLLKKMESEMGKGPSDPVSPVQGAEGLKAAIENLFYVVHLSQCKTQEAILAKKKAFEARMKKPDADAEIHNGIKDAIGTGIHVGLRYFSSKENLEEALSKLFESASIPFQDGQEVRLQDFEDSKKMLDLVIKNLGKKLGKQAAEQKLQAKRPAQIADKTNRIFLNHKADAETTLELLHAKIKAVQEKISSQKRSQQWSRDNDILKDLDAMMKTLSVFSTKEQILEDLKDLLPVDRASILQPMLPAYESAERQAALVVALQRQQLRLKANFQVGLDFKNIQAVVRAVFNTKEGAIDRLREIELAIQGIEKCIPNWSEAAGLRSKLQEINAALQSAQGPLKTYRALQRLQRLVPQLKQSIEVPNQGETRKRHLDEIRSILQDPTMPAQPFGTLFRLISEANLAAPHERHAKFQAAIDAIQQGMRTQADLRQNALNQLPDLTKLLKWIDDNIRVNEGYQKTNTEELSKKAKELETLIQETQEKVKTLEKEKQMTLQASHLTVGGAVVSAALLALFPASVVTAAGAAAYMGTKQLGPFLKGEAGKAGALTLAASAVTAGLSTYTGPSLAILTAAVAGNTVTDNIQEGLQDKIQEEIEDFFGKLYNLALSGESTEPLARIFMKAMNASHG